MPSMRPPDGCNVRGMARCRQPVVHGCPDSAPLDRWVAGAMMAGDQQNDAFAIRYRLLEAAIDRRPRGVEVHAVQVQHPVRLNASSAQPLIPASIKSSLVDRNGRRARLRRDELVRPRNHSLRLGFRPLFRCLRSRLVPRQRTNGGRDLRPQFGLVRAERAHAQRRPWGRGSTPIPRPTSRRRSLRHRVRRPNTCRSGSAP